MSEFSGDDSSETKEKIQFIPKKRRAFRQRKLSEESDDEEDRKAIQSKIEDMKVIQKLRERPNGVSVITLAIGEKVSKVDETLVSDPFKAKLGGLVNMSTLKSGKMKPVDDAYDTGIGTQFSAETNKRDEDEEMMKYIEMELSKRKGKEDDKGSEEKSKYCSAEEAALNAVPEHLRSSSSHRSEEMLSNQMLSGIPEVDLGIEAKIKNIEATEEAKLKLIKDRKNRKDGPSQFVPTNMAVNFVHHNRFNIDDSHKEKQGGNKEKPEKRKVEPTNNPTNTNTTNQKSGRTEKATDDYHYEKFKKQFRRY